MILKEIGDETFIVLNNDIIAISSIERLHKVNNRNIEMYLTCVQEPIMVQGDEAQEIWEKLSNEF